MTATLRRSGHTLVELVVALLLFEVGLMAVLGLATAAVRLSSTTAMLEGAATVAESAADSLLAHGYSGPGERSTPFGLVRWGPGEGGWIEISVSAAATGTEGGIAPSRISILLDPPAPGAPEVPQ